MGKVKENLLTKGFSGGIGEEIVFRQYRNRTIFSKRPKKSSTVTPDQQEARSHFQQAVYYAKTVLLNPTIREDYKTRAKEAGLPSAYVAAVTDFLKDLKLAGIHTDGYLGNVGDPVFITAVDDFKIQQLTVTIQDSSGAVIESGNAVRDLNGWRYEATQANANRTGTKIIVSAKDRPGKSVSEERIL